MYNENFHLPGSHYLLSHSVGAKPKAYDHHVHEGVHAAWQNSGGDAWDEWFATLDRFKSSLAPIIGADAQDIVPQINISSAVAKVLASLPARPGRRKIVLSEDDFPTIGFALGQGARDDYELEFVPGGHRLADPDAWSRAFQDDVQLVLVTHVFSNTNLKAPVAQITERARNAGVFSMLDLAQSAGVIPVDLNNWAADFAAGTSIKYLCGGPGAGFLWVRRERADQCVPRDVGWFSHENPFEFDIRHFRYAKGAARFTGGTPSIVPYAGARAGLDILNSAGIEAVYGHVQALIHAVINALPARAITSHHQAGERGAGLLIKVSNINAASAALRAAGIAHDTRAGAIRLSFHLYNEAETVTALTDILTPFVH